LIVGVVAALALAACGSSTNTGASSSGSGLEKTTLNVGVLAIADVAGLYIAMDKGYFKAEGLTVKPSIQQSTQTAIGYLDSGALDVTLGNYFGILYLTDKTQQKYKFVADTFQAKNDVFDIVVPKDSPIQSVKDLKGKKISIAALKSIGELAVDSTLRVAGLNKSDVIFQPKAFPEVPALLQTKAVDAAWLTEPFLTQVQQQQGARKLADTMTGAMADFPIAGWTATESWTKKYPKTMAAFQRAILKGQRDASADRKAVEKVLPLYTKIPPPVISVINLGAYPTSLSASRIQRVADLMTEYGYLSKKMDVTPLLAPQPQ
jgi:NitT/TauT family transport system substrate-binding protein